MVHVHAMLHIHADAALPFPFYNCCMTEIQHSLVVFAVFFHPIFYSACASVKYVDVSYFLHSPARKHCHSREHPGLHPHPRSCGGLEKNETALMKVFSPVHMKVS